MRRWWSGASPPTSDRTFMLDSFAPDWLTAPWLSGVLGHEVASFTTTRIGDGLVGMNL